MSRILNVLMLFLLCLSPLYALDSDRSAKLNIAADAGMYNFKTGVDIYEGHVKIDQGTTHITADKLITKKNARHIIEEAIAYGFHTPAHYWTKPNDTQPDIHAYANLIKFYPIDSNATLEQQVKIIQGENSFQGELIHYNSKEQTITVPAATNGHAMLVYHPDP